MFIIIIYYSLTVNDVPANDGNFTIHLVFTKIEPECCYCPMLQIRKLRLRELK